MYEFEIPEDFSSFNDEELTEIIEEAKREFYLLNDSEAIDDDTLDRMTALADGIESLYVETNARVELAHARKKKMAKKMKYSRFSRFTNLFAAKEEVLEEVEAEESVTACGDEMKADGPTFGFHVIDGDDRDFLMGLLPHHAEILDEIAATDFTNEAVAAYAGKLAGHLIKASAEIRNALEIDDYAEDADQDEDYEDEGEEVEMKADTEEFATCAAARKRVVKARRSLRRALRALRSCSGGYVVVRPFPIPMPPGPPGPPSPPPPPAPAPAP